MRTWTGSAETDGSRMNSPTKQKGKPAGEKRFQLKLNKFWRGQADVNNSASVPDGQQVETGGTTDANNSSPDARQPSPGAEVPPTEILSFEQALKRLLLCEASRQLIEREEHLFGEITETDGLKYHEEEVNKLNADREALEALVKASIRKSLIAEEFDVHMLTSAVKAICQEENQDRRWAQRDQTSPAWRPCRWRGLHDSILLSLVEESLDNPSNHAAAQEQLSSFQNDVCNMGRQMKEDLQWVVDVVKRCYPPGLDICNLYARMYHQNFGTRLRKLAEFGMDNRDSTFLLRWVNEYYPDMLNKQELLSEIDSAALGKLLSEDLTAPLEEQVLDDIQEKLVTYSDRILKDAKLAWENGEEPEREDGCFVSPVAIDVITLFSAQLKSAKTILGNQQKPKMIMCEFKHFLQRFNALQQDVMKRSKERSIIMAYLGCTKLFRDFIVQRSDFFPEDVRESCLSLVTGMKQTAHTFLLKPMHEALKPQYRKLGTSDWLKKPVFEKLLASIKDEAQLLQGLTEPCHQELMCQLQQDLTAEYVKRLLRGKVKLKNKEQQEQAAWTVCADGESLRTLFAKLGSEEAWPIDVLPQIAEVLKLQHLPAIQMEVSSLGRAFPDFSEKHVSALLKLKTNLSKANRNDVKAILADRETNTISTQPFFSRVHIW